MFQSFEAKHPKFYQVFRLFIITFASILYAWNLRCFAKTAGLFPGGFSGLSLLLQEIIIKFLHITIPFSIFNIALNLFPTYIAFKYIGKKFTIYSIIVIFLSSIFVDILPPYVFTNDVLLISVFGGIINGFAISLCLNAGATTGGTDFISIFLSHEKGIRCLELYSAWKCCNACYCRCYVWLVNRSLLNHIPSSVVLRLSSGYISVTRRKLFLLSQTSLMKYTRLLKKLLITMLLYSRELAVMKARERHFLYSVIHSEGNKTAYTAYTKC